MNKDYIIINLNKAESAESRLDRIRERVRWGVFSLLVILLVSVNVQVFRISLGYDNIIGQKKSQINNLKAEISKLESEGKNLSKDDILSFAKLEQERFLWAQNLEKMGAVTPDDIAITGLKFKRGKLIIKGVALTFEDRKDFEIIDEYVQTLRDNKEFSQNFTRIKFDGVQKVNIRGQNIIRFEIKATIKKGGNKIYS